MANGDTWNLSSLYSPTGLAEQALFPTLSGTGMVTMNPVTGVTPQLTTTGSSDWLSSISNALGTLTKGMGGGSTGLGSGAGAQGANIPPPSATRGEAMQGPPSTYHPGSPTSGIGNAMQDLMQMRAWKGLLGI